MSAKVNAAKAVIERALAAGVVVDDGNVVDLILDNLEGVSSVEARKLVGLAMPGRFPEAENRPSYELKQEGRSWNIYSVTPSGRTLIEGGFFGRHAAEEALRSWRSSTV